MGIIVWERKSILQIKIWYPKEKYNMIKMVLYNKHLELTWRCIYQSVCVFGVGELQLPMVCLDFKRRQATQVNVI
jgi:hypothetical protein